VPHHGALFAYTRWSNLHSKPRYILWGDVISGALGGVFGLRGAKDKILSGIRDIEVMPARGPDGARLANERRPFFSHTKYWQLSRPSRRDAHVEALRQVLRLGEK
jgi:hypothetical protein